MSEHSDKKKPVINPPCCSGYLSPAGTVVRLYVAFVILR
ncbi:hypothetical protein [Morganella morganii IS15]|nr:hypothetical protein CSB69_2896 [Morganella morganii]EMP53058.1 hypothetical protein C790_03034 [Morganella morganii SC01]CDK68289.1 hypothetical protein [Morganella morganii IS15]